MTAVLSPIITDAGLRAALDASRRGVTLSIERISLGEGAYEPARTRTALSAERERVPVAGGSITGASTLHLTAMADGTAEYWVREVGFHLPDGTLFAVWSHPSTPLAWKAASIDLVLALDLTLTALPAGTIAIAAGDSGLSLTIAEPLAIMATQQIAGMRRDIERYL